MTTTATPVLWISDSGEIACGQHGGAYLSAAIAARPRARTHRTPLGMWELVSDVDALRDEFASAGLPAPDCETCAAHAERELDATMREQIATAQPCDECGEIGHDADDHDEEPTPARVELANMLRASL